MRASDIEGRANSYKATITEVRNEMLSYVSGIERSLKKLASLDVDYATFENDVAEINTEGAFDDVMAKYAYYKTDKDHYLSMISDVASTLNIEDLI